MSHFILLPGSLGDVRFYTQYLRRGSHTLEGLMHELEWSRTDSHRAELLNALIDLAKVHPNIIISYLPKLHTLTFDSHATDILRNFLLTRLSLNFSTRYKV